VIQASEIRGVEWESRLAETWRKIGKLHFEGRINTMADVAYYDSLQHFKAAALLQPSEISFVEGQAKVHLAIARINIEQGRAIGASGEAGLDLVRELLERDLGNEHWLTLRSEFRKLVPSLTGVKIEEGGER